MEGELSDSQPPLPSIFRQSASRMKTLDLLTLKTNDSYPIDFDSSNTHSLTHSLNLGKFVSFAGNKTQ